MKYKKDQIDDMREMLAQRTMEVWSDRDIYDAAMDGCIGYANMPDEECIEQYENVWGVLEK